jgi:hypothetical protein
LGARSRFNAKQRAAERAAKISPDDLLDRAVGARCPEIEAQMQMPREFDFGPVIFGPVIKYEFADADCRQRDRFWD